MRWDMIDAVEAKSENNADGIFGHINIGTKETKRESTPGNEIVYFFMSSIRETK